jgi:hypothetical protein
MDGITFLVVPSSSFLEARVAEAVFVQGDTAPPVVGQILKSDQTARDLADVLEVRFQMRRSAGAKYTVDAVATITDAANGWVQYDWAANDLSVAGGDYIAQWQLTYEGDALTNSGGTWTVAVAANVVTVQTGSAHGLSAGGRIFTNGTWTANPFMANLVGATIIAAATTSFTFALTQADQGATTESNVAATITAAGKVQTTTPVNTIEVRRQ